jgi:phospholipid transport system transporter-binding protein
MRTLPELPERLTHEQADAYVQSCLAVIDSGSAAQPDAAWTLDAAALRQFDSSALAALLGVARLLQARGGRLQVLHMPLRLRELAALYGVNELLEA